MRRVKSRVPTYVGLTIALVIPVALNYIFRLSQYSPGDPARGALLLVFEWTITLFLLALVLLWERRPLSSIGLRTVSLRDILAAFGAFLLGIVGFATTIPILQGLRIGSSLPAITELATLPLWFRGLMAITAAVTEEILFRGYGIERLAELTGKVALGAGVAYAVFVALHLPLWGVGATIQIGLWSLVVTALYLRRRNLPACMLMHFLNDAYALMVLPSLLALQP